MEEQVIDNVEMVGDKVLDTVLARLDYNFTRDMLVKPMEEVYVEKEIVKPVSTGEIDPATDAEIFDTETEVEKTLANFRKGIVLALPSNYTWPDPENHPEVGDIVAYSRKGAIEFDLFKDAQVVNPYNVVAWIKK